MIPSDQTTPRQRTERHRRSDRYQEQASQQPVSPRPAQPQSQAAAPSSFPGKPQAYAQPMQRAQAPQQPAPQPTAQQPYQTNTRMQLPQQQQPTPPQPSAQQSYQTNTRMQLPQQQQPTPPQPTAQQPYQTNTRMQLPQQQQPTPPQQQVPQQPYQGGWTLPPQPVQQPNPWDQISYPPQPNYVHQAEREQPVSRMAMNGQPAPQPVPPSGYGWAGAGQSYDQRQGNWQGYNGYAPSMSGGSDAGSGDPIAPMPMPFMHSPRHYHGGGSDGRPPLRMQWWMIALAALAVVVLAVVGISAGRNAVQEQKLRSYVSSYDTRYCQGVYVDGIHLGGMTQQEALNVVTAQAQQRNNDWYVRLTYQGQTVVEFKADQLGMRIDVDDALREAWQQGHSGADARAREAEMQQLMAAPYYGYTVLPSGDTSVVDSTLEELRNRVYRAPQDAAIIEFDPAKTNPFTIQEEVWGQMLNTDGLKTDIYHMVSAMQSGELEIHLDTIAPNVTAAQLAQTVTLRADEYTEISTTSTDERNKNIKRAFELINGTVIPPGQSFSFNGVVGRRTTENGFFEALEYQYGSEVMGIGGGVCQASTSMYLAAVAANLEITKHTPHSMQVGYTTYGRDATVSWEGTRQIDFAFRNNTDSNIYICASVQYNPSISKYSIARVRIYGMSLGEGVTYQLVSEEIETIPIPETPEYRKDNKGQYVTYTDEEYQFSKGREGHITQSWRVKYVNGVEVERTPMYRDEYKAAAPIVYRGVQKRPSY